MKENENNEQKSQKKRMAWLYTLFTVLVFAPTVVIVIILMVQNADGAASNSGGKDSLTDGIPSVSSEDYLALTIDATKCDGLPEKYKDPDHTEIIEGDKTYRFYFSADGLEAYFSVDGKYYKVDSEKLSKFNAKKDNIEGTANIPVMFYNGDKVYPISASFYFRTESGSMVNLSGNGAAPTEAVASSNCFVLVSFDDAPDECSVTLYDGEKIVFSGSPQVLSEYSFAGYDSLICHVFAKWKDSKGSIGGSATYRFTVSLGEGDTKIPDNSESEPPKPAFECMLDNNILAIGEYTVLRMKNVEDLSKLKLSFTPSLPYEPMMIRNGEEYCTIVAVPMDSETSPHFINVEYEGNVTTLRYDVKSRVYKEREYDASATLIKISRNPKAMEEYEDIKTVINGIESYKIEDTDSLGDYTKTVYNDQNIYLGYGYYRKLIDGTKYRMDGVDYRLTEGSVITSIAKGKVIYTGYSQYLGYYVVVDHGCGIRTWYAHLSVITVHENDIVNAGDNLGYAGKTGFTTTCGVYLMCTVNGICISPYRIIENGILGVYNDNEYGEMILG